MFAAPSCTTCVIVAASLHVSKKSCHNALLKPQLLRKAIRRSFGTFIKKPPRLLPRRFFYAPVWQGRGVGELTACDFQHFSASALGCCMAASIVGLEVACTNDLGATGETIASTAACVVTTARCAWCAAVAIVSCFEAVATTVVGALIATGLETAFATARCKAALFAAEITAGFETTFGTEIATTFATALRATFKARCRCTATFKTITTTFEAVTATVAFKARCATRFETIATAVAAEATTATTERTTTAAAVIATTA